MRHASIASNKMRSPLKETMRVNPSGGGRSKKKIVIALVLTSLVDAFSIMLLYLLVNNTGNGSTVELNRAEKLPMAIKNEALMNGTLIRIEGTHYFLGEQSIGKDQLPLALQNIKAKNPTGADSDALIIQADKNIDFSMLAPVIRAGSVTGFHKFKFAVIQSEASL